MMQDSVDVLVGRGAESVLLEAVLTALRKIEGLCVRTPGPTAEAGGAETPAQVISQAMMSYEAAAQARPPSWVLVVGTGDDALGGMIAAKKILLPVALLCAADVPARGGSAAQNEAIMAALADLVAAPSEDVARFMQRAGISPARILRADGLDSVEVLVAKLVAEMAGAAVSARRR
jgi:UDP-N-acetylglucosamine 2-epimerase